jgi:heterodisulfide reductase subunit A
VVTAIEFERLLSASGPTGGHLDRPSDRAVEAEIEALEKKAKKSLKMIGKFEDKYGENSSAFYEKYQGGDYQDDEDRKKWAGKYAEHLQIMEPLEALKKKAEGFSVAKKLAFIQCVGSRDFRFYPFCSGYCCMHSIKEAIIAHEHESETTSTIFGMDIRAVGKGFEEYKVRGGNNSNITYARGRVAEIIEGPNNNPVVIYENTLERMVKQEEFDLVILATACAPNQGVKHLAEILDIEIDNFGFYKTSAAQPLDTTRPGVFVCGCAHGPMDIPESVAQASSAAARAVQIMTASEEVRKAS